MFIISAVAPSMNYFILLCLGRVNFEFLVLRRTFGGDRDNITTQPALTIKMRFSGFILYYAISVLYFMDCFEILDNLS